MSPDLAARAQPPSETTRAARARAKLVTIQAAIASVQQESGITDSPVRILGASKAQPLERLRAFATAGIVGFGENYLQDALPKLDALHDSTVEWHFIGRIQSNKARDVATRFDWAQTLDSERLIRRLSDARTAHHPDLPLNCCIQVNIDEEPQKAGAALGDFDKLVRVAGQSPGLRLRGVMAIPAPHPNPAERIASFRRVRALFDNANPPHPKHWDTVSMGMSDDYLDAVRCGANLVRLGTALFGPRPPR